MIIYCLTEVFGEQDGLLVVDGRLWRLMPYDLDADACPEFICASYTWGTGRESSPFHDNFLVSDRTVPVIRAIARLRPACRHIWVDAFCVPLESPERGLTLESMGYIYAIAYEVVAILSQSVLPALRNIISKRPLTDDLMSILEKDEWVTRAWTYQETANARALFISCDGAADNIIVSGQELINSVGHALSRLTIPPLERRAQHPGLDALEDLVDYRTAGPGERSAVQVMAMMDRRKQQRPADHFYAMIGAISAARPSSVGANDASEAFMQTCEAKGDFSFIFSAARRETEAGRRWRPVRGNIPAILSWDVWGPAQAGEITADGLRLDSVVKLSEGNLRTAAKAYIRTWLQRTRIYTNENDSGDGELIRGALSALRLMGFTGSGECLNTSAGLFWTYESLFGSQPGFILVSSSLRWPFGSPGILNYISGSRSLYTAGVFVGCVDYFPVTSVFLSS